MAAPSNILDQLLERVEDPSLRKDLRAQINHLRDVKEFGLVFERHLPETVQLINEPVRRGVKVRSRTEDSATVLGEVVSVGGDQAKVYADGEVTEHDVEDLVVIADFGDPIFPGLTELGRIEEGGDKPFHTVINGENYHALQMLEYTHTERVSVAYIDVPYNLGGDLTYNDQRVEKDDKFRHSKWLSFMDRRLRIARRLLTETGVMIVAIDDTEMAHLRLLMDEIFGPQNFIATVVWQGGRKNDSRYVSVGHDYMLIYAKNEQALRDAEILWREPKDGVEEALATAQRIWKRHKGDTEAATAQWREYLDGQRSSGATTDAVNRYDRLEPETGRPINTYGNITWPGGGGPRYEVLHPTTGKPVKLPRPGWRFKKERMQELIDEGRIWFGEDETTIPRGITYLDEMSEQVPTSVFEQGRKATDTALRKMLGGKRFSYPKDPRVLARWIHLATQGDPDAVVLDFFAGSGSTAHAVMDLNASDGGRRQCILVTNNEVDAKRARKLKRSGHAPGDPEWERWGIFEYVTRPRIETVVTGVNPDGDEHGDGREENVVFLELDYLNPDQVERGRDAELVGRLLWLAGGARGPVCDLADDAGDAWSAPVGATYAILHDPSAAAELAEAIMDRPEVRQVFVVTDSPSRYHQAVRELPVGLRLSRLYEDYLSSFRINTGGAR